DEDTPYYEAWTLIAALGALTHRLRFGVMVSGNTYRNPGLLAKEAVTVDHASNGRVELGIGSGWMEREHVAYSFPFPPVGARIDMLEEALQVIDQLMTERRTHFQGRYYQFVDAPFEPKPLQQPRIPIVIGAFKPRMIALAARYADTWNTRGSASEADARETVAPRVEEFREAARAAGRDPDDIRMSIYTWDSPFTSEERFRDVVLAYRRLGFTDFIFPMPPVDEVPVMERCAREVIPELRRLG
ncbi:MAG: LLM class flavin-dependent oxidoreductase, partial [Thermomicrobiaceae bacterium]|nr:LLM class flavin-dependent oxidoreductase [Thermomicrobiaceae bacterium]